MAQEMVSRMSLIVWLLEAKKVLWVYEQPASSLLWEHNRMRSLVKSRFIYRTHMFMGSYGAPTKKPTMLWGPDPLINMFSIPLPTNVQWEKDLVSTYVRDGRTWVTGNSNLKGSQSYPKAFGVATLGIWKTWRDWQTDTNPFNGAVPSQPADATLWRDAGVPEVIQFLASRIQKWMQG